MFDPIGDEKLCIYTTLNIKLYHVKKLNAESSSGDLYWVENQYVMVSMFLKEVKNEYSPHNFSILWALKNYLYILKSAKKNTFMQHLTKYEVFKKIYHSEID